MIFVQWLFVVVGAVLQLLLINSLLRGPYRKFPLLFAYSIALFLTTVVEVSFYFGDAVWSEMGKKYYWIGELIRQALVFAIVISLIWKHMLRNPLHASMARFLLSAAAVFTLGSVIWLRGDVLGAWMTQVSRNVSFCALALNLVLWGALIRGRGKDRQPLLVSGGLGIQMAGQAIGQSVRQLAIANRSHALVNTGNIIMLGSHLLSLYIWWRAFPRTAGQPVSDESLHKA